MKKVITYVLCIAILLCVFAACNVANGKVSPSPTNTPVTTRTPSPTVTVVPTNTPVPTNTTPLTTPSANQNIQAP